MPKKNTFIRLICAETSKKMIVTLWLLVLLVSVESIMISMIREAEYRPISQDPIIMNGTCDECLCQSLLYDNANLYVAFNCFEHDKRCEFYHNYSSWYSMVNNSNSRFYFYRNPPPLPVCYRKILLSMNIDLLSYLF